MTEDGEYQAYVLGYENIKFFERTWEELCMEIKLWANQCKHQVQVTFILDSVEL
ncbi:MAG: hypothetical protein KGH65_05565 [Candidatus Micrarchaeota archaeon]|nr:hypothetical protein [Candidatus Micrarchaeota archaeon]